MLKLFKALVILTLVGAIAGGLYGAYFFLVELPKAQDAALMLTAPQPGQPAPDPGKDDFAKAQALKKDRKYGEAKAALESFLTHYPDSSHKNDVESMLGDINLSELFSGSPGPGKVEYIVSSGDTLDRVARKTKSNPETIFQANGLERTMLRIGQKLEIPQTNFSIEIHLDGKRVYLLNQGRFFKAYDIINERPPGKKVTEIRTKVSEKRAYRDGKLVAFGGKDFLGSARSLVLDKQPAYTITAQAEGPAADPAATDKPAAPAAGLVLAFSDAEELHTLVSLGTPVTISSE